MESTPFILLVAVIIGLTQAVKLAGLDTRWAPLVSIGFGILGALFIGIENGTIIGGIVAGLTASGLWSGTKATIANS